MRTLARWAGSSGFPGANPTCKVYVSGTLSPLLSISGRIRICRAAAEESWTTWRCSSTSNLVACYPWVRNSPTLTRRSYSMHWPKSSCDSAYYPTSAFFGQGYLNLPYIVDAMGMYQIWFLNPHWKFNFSAACGRSFQCGVEWCKTIIFGCCRHVISSKFTSSGGCIS